MKKNLLALFALGATCGSLYAQNTFINDAVIVKVNPNTLFYNGGSVTVNTTATTATTEKIINEGNIQIVGGFTNQNTTGKNFVNRYTSNNSYGQLRIKDDQSPNVTGRVVMERVKPTYSSTNNQYLISLPFKGAASDVINSLTTAGNIFKADCPVDAFCGDENRRLQSLLVWDVAQSEYDVIPSNYSIEPYKRYLLQLSSGNSVYDAVNGMTAKIAFSGVPNNQSHNITNIVSGWARSDNFASQTFGSWKNRVNNYNQSYASYLGNGTTSHDTNLYYGKNLHRFGNPYTSNLDLSNIQTGSSWLTFNTTSGVQSPTQVYDNILWFKVYKLANGYSINWNQQNGNVSTSSVSTSFNAYLSKNTSTNQYFWTGSPDALLIKPYETFYIDYSGGINPTFNPAGNIIVSANINLTDNNKTFDQDFSQRTPIGQGTLPGVFTRSASNNNKVNQLLNDEDLKAKGLVTDFDFTQLELFLTEDNTIKGNPAYLLNAPFMKTGTIQNGVKNIVDNNISFYEEANDNYQNEANEFNSEDYIGKPIRVGLNKLEEGKEYKLNLNLYEHSILNKVSNLNLGKYYLLDTSTKKVIEVDANTEITFTADGKEDKRFEFYWNEKPQGTLDTNDLNKANATYLYSNNGNQFIKFEQTNTTADISIYDLTGRQVFSKSSIATNQDFKLNLNNIPSIYVVKIVYKDGKTVTKKTINK